MFRGGRIVRAWILAAVVGLSVVSSGCVAPLGYAKEAENKGGEPARIEHHVTFGVLSVATEKKIWIVLPLYQAKYAEYVNEGNE